MAYFLLRLTPSRSTFSQDMTEAERQIMREHVTYWLGQIAKGRLLVFGPVTDPKGGWELGILSIESAEAAGLLTQDDPVIKAKLHTIDILPMPTVVMK